ncbi:hypothetical protein ZOSMA_163G00160 [Zostera marina]|uniref:Uncharacterized protein n=1 Tax=Zostera marina TaxID=29655 RepID=A0A0K9PU15_ZOSMR|nr:hypothetical protein ZOSMA_163G00160 [Zostera marina]
MKTEAPRLIIISDDDSDIPTTGIETSDVPSIGNETSEIPSTANEISTGQDDSSSFVFPPGLFSLPDFLDPGFVVEPTQYDGKNLTEYNVTSPYHGHPIHSSSSNVPCANQDHSNRVFPNHQAFPQSYHKGYPHVMPNFNHTYPNTFHDNILILFMTISIIIQTISHISFPSYLISPHYYSYERHHFYPYMYDIGFNLYLIILMSFILLVMSSFLEKVTSSIIRDCRHR